MFDYVVKSVNNDMERHKVSGSNKNSINLMKRVAQ